MSNTFEELEHIRINDDEYYLLINQYGTLETQAMLRLLNIIKSKDTYKGLTSDFNAISKFVRKTFDSDLQDLKDECVKVKVPVNEKKIINGMYRKENGYHWTGVRYARCEPIQYEVHPDTQAIIDKMISGEIDTETETGYALITDAAEERRGTKTKEYPKPRTYNEAMKILNKQINE